MRPQLYTADAIARLAAQPLSRPSARIDKPTGGFDSLLKEVRSAREASRRKINQSAPSPESEAAPDSQPASEDSAASANQDIAASKPESGAEASPVPAPQNPAPSEESRQSNQPVPAELEDVKPVVQAVVPVAQANVTEVGADGDASNGESSAKLVQAIAGSPEQTSQPVSPGPATAPLAETEALAAEAFAAGVRTRAAGSQSGVQDADPDHTASAESGKNESSSSEAEQVPVGRRPETQKDLPNPVANSGSAKDDTRPRIGRDSWHQLKVDGSEKQRSDGLLDPRLDKSQQSDAAAARPGDARPVGDRSRVAGQAIETPEPEKPTGFRVIAGDSEATSIARFLISPPAGAGGSTTADQAAASAMGPAQSSPVSPATGTQVGRPTTGPAATAMDGVLSSGLDAPVSLDSAARVLSGSAGDGRYHVTMQLDPPDLGQLRLQIHMEQHVMTLQVDADTSASARLIESRLSDLRDALASHGIRMDRNDVVVRSPASADANPQNQDGGQNGSGSQERGMADGSGGWLSDGRQTTGSQEQGSSDQGTGGDYGQVADANEGAVMMDDDRAAVEWMATTELSLDLVA
jgi:flagellar hook-length control protein FliK